MALVLLTLNFLQSCTGYADSSLGHWDDSSTSRSRLGVGCVHLMKAPFHKIQPACSCWYGYSITCGPRVLLQPLLAQILQKIYGFWNDIKAESKDSGRARWVLSFRFTAHACNLLWSGDRPQTRAVAHIVCEVFVNMAVMRKFDVSNKYNSLKARLGVMS